jgi:UPF0716 protein FxsA
VFLLLAIAFVAIPLIEIYVIVQVGQAIGVWNTLAIMIAVSLVGAWLAKHEGLWVLLRVRQQLDAGRMPTDELIDGFLVLAGGMLLLLPGFVSDAMGIVALFPPTRALLRGVVRRRFRIVSFRAGGPTGPRGPRGPDDVIDV